MKTRVKHRFSDAIKAWADGKPIQYRKVDESDEKNSKMKYSAKREGLGHYNYRGFPITKSENIL